MSLRRVEADLHIHTALSPCGADEMTPPAIVETALARGLGMIAICDHNCARNTAAVQEAADGRLAVIAGMEVTSVEEVHVVGLFPTAGAAEAAAGEVRALLPEVDDDYTTFFGDQPVLSADGLRVDTETAALALAPPLELAAVVSLVKRHGGLATAAHVDRKAFGVISQLGFFPADAGFDGVEVSRNTRSDSPRMHEFRALGLPLVGSSDAHYLEDIGQARTVLVVQAPTFDELVLALAGIGGRSVDRA